MGFDAQSFGRLTPTELKAHLEIWNRKQDREDHRFASIEAILAEINRDPKKRSAPFQPTDFYHSRIRPKAQEPAPEPVPEWKNQLAIVEALNAAMGGKDLRKKEGTHETDS